MKLLCTHRVYPGQFRNLLNFLAKDTRHHVEFLAYRLHEAPPDNVKVAMYQPARLVAEETHPYMQSCENAVLFGQAAYRIATKMKQQGFYPDVIFGHSGWGPTLYLQEVFPKARMICYFEWFYRARGSSHGFHPNIPLLPEHEAQIRTKNAPILMDLVAAKAGQTPTDWQRRQFPSEHQPKIEVIHDGVDTEYFSPQPTGLFLPRLGLDLRNASKLVTYVATGMEPMRGFPEFMQAVSQLQQRCPQCEIVVVGEDRTEYSNPLASGKTYRQLMMELYPYDLKRIHFTGRLSIDEYRQVLRASAAHVYFTFPYILSWSMLEAMACGCLVVGSATPPVQEVIRDRENGVLCDFFAITQLTDILAEALEQPAAYSQIRENARDTILQRYDARLMLQRQWEFVQRGCETR